MKETVSVVVDGREPEAVVDALAKHPEVSNVKVSMLDVADLVVGKNLEVEEGLVTGDVAAAFERKTPSDWIGSIKEGKLNRQVDELMHRYSNSYLLFEGDLSEVTTPEHSGMKPASIRGSMAKYTALGAPVLLCSTPRLLVDMAVRVSRKHIEDSDLSYLETGPIEDRQPTAMQMYGCLPGVGPETAKKLYDRWPVPANLLAVGIEELTEVEGIGETTAERIISMVREGQDDA